MSLTRFEKENINLLSKRVEKYLEDRKLGPTSVVKYRLLVGVKNLDPTKKPGEDVLLPSSLNISVSGTIIDPGDPSKETGKINSGYKKLGIVKEFDAKTQAPIFKKFKLQPQRNDPYFMIRGNVAVEAEFYDMLELSNENKSNPFRDVSVEPTFERVDDVAEAKVRSNKRNTLNDCYNAIKRWNLDETRVIAGAYNLNIGLEIDVLKDKLQEIAEKEPATFYKSIDSEQTKVKSLVGIAKTNGIISFNQIDQKWSYTDSGELILTVDRKEGVDPVHQFGEWLLTAANGPAVRGNIEKLLRKKLNNQ